jgi:hypothetical protein
VLDAGVVFPYIEVKDTRIMPNRKARQAIWQKSWPTVLVLLALLAPLVPAQALAGPASHACCSPATAPCPVLTKARTMDCCAMSTPVVPTRSLGSVGFIPLWAGAGTSSMLAGGKTVPDVLVATAEPMELRQRGAPLFLLHSSLLR